MSITVELYLDSAWRSVEAQQPIIINEALHNSLASATSSCRVNIIPNSTIKNYLLGLENADADIRIKDGSTVLFQGLIRKNFTIRKLEQRQDLYGLEAVGYLIKLDRKVKEDKQYISKSVSYIVEDLFTELGINYSLPTITSIINNLYIKRGESYRIIEQLLKEYGYILYVDNEGTARAIEISPASITTTETFYDSNTLDALELNKKEQDKERIEIEYRQQKTAASGIVFSDTTNAQGVYKCYIQLAAGAYLGGQQYVYADLVYDGKKVIALSSHTLDITADSGITVSTNILEGNKVKLSIQNTSGITKNIYKLDIIGSGIVYEDSAGKEIATSNSDTDKIETIQAKYLFTSTNAQSYAQKLLNYYKYSDFVYTLSSMTDATLGEQVLLDHEGIGSINARIIEKQKDYQTGKIRYKLEGISEYSAESSESEPAYTAPDPLNNQAIILTYPEQPTNNVTDVTASFSENADGTANVVVEFNYTQGEKPATQFLCYVLRSFSTPGSIDYYNDQAIAKPYIEDGSYSIKFALPTRAGSAPIHYKIGVIAANGAKLHADGAVIPTGWSDKVLAGGITYDENNYWDLDNGELRAGSSLAYIKLNPSNNEIIIKGLTMDIDEGGIINKGFTNDVKIIDGDILFTAKNGEIHSCIDGQSGSAILNNFKTTIKSDKNIFSISASTIINFGCSTCKCVVYNNLLYLFYKKISNNYFVYKTWDGTTWSSETTLFTGSQTPVAAIVFNEKIYVYYVMANIYITNCIIYNGNEWSDVTVEEDRILNASVCIFNGKIYLFYGLYSDSKYYYRIFDGVNLSDRYLLLETAPTEAIARQYNNKIIIAYQKSSDTYLYYRIFDGITISSETSITESNNYILSMYEYTGNLYLTYYRSNKLYYKVYNNIAWSTESEAVNVGYEVGTSDMIVYNSKLYLFYNNSNTYYIYCNVLDVLYEIGAGIIEEGTNSNGSYIKFSNGTMVCYGKKSVNTTMTVLNANVGTYGWSFYYLPFTAGIVVDLPASYLSSSSYIFISEADGGKLYYPYHQNNTASQVKFGYVAYDGSNATFTWQTIGRWK